MFICPEISSSSPTWHLNPAVLLLSATSTQVRTLWYHTLRIRQLLTAFLAFREHFTPPDRFSDIYGNHYSLLQSIHCTYPFSSMFSQQTQVSSRFLKSPLYSLSPLQHTPSNSAYHLQVQQYFFFFASYAIIQNIHHSPLLICFFCLCSN